MYCASPPRRLISFHWCLPLLPCVIYATPRAATIPTRSSSRRRTSEYRLPWDVVINGYEGLDTDVVAHGKCMA
ncbi:uncharacterized protein EV420DRAFT_320916 [Desarmillaria tabescens]|uniref:Secreted protein n=1 Tax=Armillaria tabescens TaxID=1929756 RepID=A0AA39J3M6_ARMTA|nr:uncharacterized protein EV420DRAFT_320916 [Desarmillaria tabescens]KAK0435443.1 hypothetical protein EV420DRAFT_320916 [Desarmillaria tabescens]